MKKDMNSDRSEDARVSWRELYSYWNLAIKKFPQLGSETSCLKVDITEPKFVPIYYFNWVPKAETQKAVQADIKQLASGWPEIGDSWSKGTVRTAGLLASCETKEETAAVWLSAFALSLLRKGKHWNTTKRNAADIEQEAHILLAGKHGYWHASSKEFFPQFYIPEKLFWESQELSVSTLVELAALNAALVSANFVPVEYKLV